MACTDLPPVGVAVSSYMPGPSLSPPMLPSKVKLFVAVLPTRVSSPCTRTGRTQTFCLPFLGVGFMHRPESLRPVVLSVTVTVSAALSV